MIVNSKITRVHSMTYYVSDRLKPSSINTHWRYPCKFERWNLLIVAVRWFLANAFGYRFWLAENLHTIFYTLT